MSDNYRIKVHGWNDNNTIIERAYPTTEAFHDRLNPMGGSLASKNVRLFFRETAVARLFEAISWGRAYRNGDVEKAGILIGNYCRDSSHRCQIIWGDVAAVIPADPILVHATFNNIDITAAAWKKLHEDAAEYKANKLQVLGWYHTHLNNTHAYFSDLDRKTQYQAFTFEYSFGVVFNPNQRKWSVFYGRNSNECVGEFFLDKQLEYRYGNPKITIQQINGDFELRENWLISSSPYYISNTNFQGKQGNIAESPSLRQILGQFLDDMGSLMKDMKPRKSSIKQRYHPAPPPPYMRADMQRQQSGTPQMQTRNITFPQPVSQPKPKITILNNESANEKRLIVKSSVWVVSTQNLMDEHADDDLLVMDDNIIEVVSEIERRNQYTSQGSEQAISAHINMQPDRTLELRLCENNNNAEIRISKRRFDEAFPLDWLKNRVKDFFKKDENRPVGIRYLLFVSRTQANIELLVIQINKEDRT